MGATEVKAGRAFIEVYIKNMLAGGLKSIGSTLKSAGSMLGGIGLGMSGALAPFAAALGDFSSLAQGNLLGSVFNLFSQGSRTFADVGSALNDMSARTGVSAQTLSELEYGAKLTGASMETLEGAITKSNKALSMAASGNKAAIAAFQGIGLSVKDLVGLSPEERFKAIAEGISRIKDPADKARAAMAIFGKTGTQLLPMLADGAAGIEAFQKQARNLGLSISDEDAAKADKLGDRMDMLGRILRDVLFEAGAAVADVLIDLAEQIATVARAVAQWISENRQFIATMARLVLIVGLVGAGLALLGGIIFGAGMAFTAIAGGILAAISGLSTLVGIIGSVGAAVGAFLISPFGIVIVLILAAAAAVLYFTGTAEYLYTSAMAAFADLLGQAMATFQGIYDAIAAGNLALAFEVAWASALVVWQKGINALMGYWVGFKEMFFGSITAVTEFFTTAWNNAVGYVAKLLARIWGFFDRSLDVQAVVDQIDQDTGAKNQAAKDAREKADQERQAKYLADITAAQDALEKANGRFNAATKQAAEERKKTAADFEGKLPDRLSIGLPEITSAGSAGSSLGTFSAAAAGLLGQAGSSTAERTAKGIEELVDDSSEHGDLLSSIEKNTAKMGKFV